MSTKGSRKTRYSALELLEFKALVEQKLAISQKELAFIQEGLSKRKSNDVNTLPGNTNVNEDGSEAMEREKLSQLAGRQMRFIQQLKGALVRIENGTYGVCVATGRLISKQRLRQVPHTTHSIEAKNKGA